MPQLVLRRRAIAIVEAIVVLAAVIIVQYFLASAGRRPAMVDFRVVYCGERAIVHRADPYLVEPLRTCENAVKPDAGDEPWMVTPFPLPGYAAAIFSPLSVVPFRVAEFAWLCLLTLAFGIVATALAELTETPRTWPIALVLAPTIGVLNQYYGEPVDIAIAAFCVAAFCAARGRPRAAAVAAAIAMIEPHVGLGACVGLFVFTPRARATLLGLGAVFAVVSLAVLGVHENLEYFTQFLPLQAHAELYAADQYSLSRILFLAGLSPATSLLIGSLSYAIMLAIGLVAARQLVKLGCSQSLLVLLPVAASMLGGSFVHDVEMAAALPAAVVLAKRSALARFAVSLLAMQWGYELRNVVGLLATATIGVVSFAFSARTALARRIAYAIGIVIVFSVVDVSTIPLAHAQALRGKPPVAILPATLSPVPWEWSIRLTPVSLDFDPRQIWFKLPTWLGLIAIPLAAIELRLRKPSPKSAM